LSEAEIEIEREVTLGVETCEVGVALVLGIGLFEVGERYIRFWATNQIENTE